jgi:hypothetical protein
LQRTDEKSWIDQVFLMTSYYYDYYRACYGE